MKWRPTIRGQRTLARVNGAKVSRDTKAKEVGTKLTAESAAYIKGQLLAGASQSWLAMKFGVSNVTILNIGAGKKWAEVKPQELELEGPPKGSHVKKWLKEHGRSI